MRKKRAEHANWLMTTRQFRLEVCKAKCRTAQWQPGHKGGGDRGRAVWQTKASSDPQQQQHKTHTSSHNEKGIKMRSVPELSWVRRCFRPHTTWRTLVLSTSLSLSPSPSPSPYLFFLCALAVRCHSSAWIINRFFDANRWENLSYLIDRKIAATRLTQHRQHSSNCWEKKEGQRERGRARTELDICLNNANWAAHVLKKNNLRVCCVHYRKRSRMKREMCLWQIY